MSLKYAVLLHELAHVRQRDCLAYLLSQLTARVLAIVSGNRRRRPPGRALKVLLAAAVSAGLLAIAGTTPAVPGAVLAADEGAPSTGAPSAGAASPTAESTLDPRLQTIADQELERAMREWSPAAGVVVVLNPSTGEILADAGRTQGAPAEVAAGSTYLTGELVLHIARGPTGLIRTIRAYENYVLEYEWRHLTEAPNANGTSESSGNSGVIIAHSAYPKPGGPYPNEGHEVQVCNLGNGSWYTSHGDIFTMPGSTSTGIPDPRFGSSHSCGHRSMPVAFHGRKTGEWNRIRLTCVDGVIQNEVNGHLVAALYRVSPRKGYLSIESEGAPVEFRNMRLQELAPDPDLAPKHIAPLLPEEMTTDYLKAGVAVPLPAGNFIAMVDVSATLPLSTLISGMGLPGRPAKGRVQASVRDGKVSVTEEGREVVPAQTLPADGRGVLHLESGTFGHALLFRPAPPR